MLLSVILPTFNRAHLISKAIESVLPQLAPSDELIVVDDGSTDNTEDVVRGYAGPIRYVKIRNQGAGAARNVGIAQSRGELLAFVDSDDFWLPNKVACQRVVMQTMPDLVCSFTDFLTTRSDGRTYHGGLRFWSNNEQGWRSRLADTREAPGCAAAGAPLQERVAVHCGDMYPVLMGGNYVPIWTTMIRKASLQATDLFPTDVRTYEEWEFLGRVMQRGPVGFIEMESVHSIAHQGPRLTDIHFIGRLECQLKILQRVWGVDGRIASEHRTAYEKELQHLATVLTRHYLASGASTRARDFLRICPRPPLVLRGLAILPPVLLRALAGLRQAARGTVRS